MLGIEPSCREYRLPAADSAGRLAMSRTKGTSDKGFPVCSDRIPLFVVTAFMRSVRTQP
jgi:hypothetical protein